MLSVIDDGQGMKHNEVVKMVSFGHKQPDKDVKDRIGRFGVGFKVVMFLFLIFLVLVFCPGCVELFTFISVFWDRVV